MPSIDVLAETLWNVQKPPLSLLTTASCMRAACAGLADEDRAPFDALGEAVLAWWPKRSRTPQELYDVELAACRARHAQAQAGELGLAMEAANGLMAALLRLAPRTFPGEGIYDFGEKELTALVRKLAKKTHTDLTLWGGRFEQFLATKDLAWDAQVAGAARMGFERDMHGLRGLEKQLQELGRFADLGAVVSWSEMGAKHALRLELGTVKRIAMLDDARRDALTESLPWLVDTARLPEAPAT